MLSNVGEWDEATHSGVVSGTQNLSCHSRDSAGKYTDTDPLRTYTSDIPVLQGRTFTRGSQREVDAVDQRQSLLRVIKVVKCSALVAEPVHTFGSVGRDERKFSTVQSTQDSDWHGSAHNK